ncbi:hypothetical protein OIDMADRAFT_176103 [Oidiodendron maius Zn]|uniref:Uncharacterized protein n=1 Tax=Oidiodendron maius (strain Zn) TaxID=913774 RepID=A0A0C3D3X0_OIDMZ|nr:hypothetical protein OIDMADRAFT_176103 [Oidiodendron maius Zn]
MGELVDRRLGPRYCRFLYLRRVAGLKCCADVMVGPENIDDRARPGTVGLEGNPWTEEDVRRNVKGEFFLQTKEEEDEEGGGGGGGEETCRPKRNASTEIRCQDQDRQPKPSGPPPGRGHGGGATTKALGLPSPTTGARLLLRPGTHSPTPAPDDLLLARPPTRTRCCYFYGAPHSSDRQQGQEQARRVQIASRKEPSRSAGLARKEFRVMGIVGASFVPGSIRGVRFSPWLLEEGCSPLPWTCTRSCTQADGYAL